MQNHAKVGGILSIVAGAFGIFWLLFFVFFAFLVTPAFRESSNNFGYGTTEDFYILFMVIYGVIGFLYALVGTLAIVGGVFALRKKHWGWALAGAIAGTLTFLPCGIPAIIFVSMGKPEFETPGSPAPMGPMTG